MNFFNKFFSSKKSSTPSPTRNLKQRGDIDHSAYSDEALHQQTEKRRKQMPAENVGRTGRGKGGVIDRDRLKEYIEKTLIPQVRVAKDKTFFWAQWKKFVTEYNEGREKGFECQAREAVVRFHTWERDPNARLKGSNASSIWSFIATDKKNEGRRKGTLVLEEEALRRQADEIAGSREDANKFYGQVGRVLIERFPGENFTNPWTADELWDAIDKLNTEDAMDQATPKYMRDQLDQAKHGAGRTDEELAKEPTLAERCAALRKAGKDEEAEALMNAEADRLIERADETKRELGLVMHQ